MMSDAQHHEILGSILASLRPWHEMMNIDEDSVPAPRHHALPAVAPFHGKPKRRRNVLPSARAT
jgi:hypothetical protein